MRVEARDGRGLCGFSARGGLTGQVGLWFELSKCKGHGVRVAVWSERINPWTAGIAEAEKLCDFVEGFAGCVVDGAADEGVGPCTVGVAAGRLSEKEVGVAAGDNEGEG